MSNGMGDAKGTKTRSWRELVAARRCVSSGIILVKHEQNDTGSCKM